jgi:broad specificity phosphatase PhoE
MTTTVLVVRHGQTYGNIEGRFCGHSETDLTPLGIAQARALGRRLSDVSADAAFSSDLSRASETARHALSGRDPIQLVLDPRLREMHYGEWEARPGREIGQRQPDLLREFFQCKVPAPGGETLEQLRARTAASVRDAVDAHRGGTVLVFSHGNAIMAMIAEFLRLPIAQTWSLAVDNTSIARMSFSKSGRFTLLSFNDAAHTHGLTEANA